MSQNNFMMKGACLIGDNSEWHARIRKVRGAHLAYRSSPRLPERNPKDIQIVSLKQWITCSFAALIRPFVPSKRDAYELAPCVLKKKFAWTYETGRPTETMQFVKIRACDRPE